MNVNSVYFIYPCDSSNLCPSTSLSPSPNPSPSSGPGPSPRLKLHPILNLGLHPSLRPRSRPQSESNSASESQVESEAQHPGPSTLEESGDLPPHQDKIIYTFHYDLESVWWINLWTSLVWIAHTRTKLCTPHFVDRLENTPERTRIFLVPGLLRSQLTNVLHKDLRL